MSDYVRRLREKVGQDLLFWPAVACLVWDEHDRLLLVRHVEGRWTLPAGAIDPGETPVEAARREAREEASVEIDVLGLVGVYGGGPAFHGFYANGDEVAWVTVVFEARIQSGVLTPGDDETAEVRWVTLDEASTIGVSPSTQHILERARANQSFDA